jgi:hypothetical protein
MLSAKTGLTEIYMHARRQFWLLVVNFNFSFSNGFSCRADSYKIPALRQASNVDDKRNEHTTNFGQNRL